MLISLLPVLGLLAAISVSADVSGGGASHGMGASLSTAAGQSRHDAAGDFYPSDQALRNTWRRAGVSSGPNGAGLPVTVFASGLTEFKPDVVSFPVVAAPAELVRGWQFHYRAVSEPRAPSAVS